jgi:hypothetical protein
MERKTPSARRIGMMSHRQARRGPVVAAGWVLLCAAGALAAGCGSVVASGGAASPPAGSAASASSASGASGGAAAGASASAAGASAAGASASASVGSAAPGGSSAGAAADLVGCASVDQATSVSIIRLTRLEVPVDGGTLMATNRQPAQVRALFGDLCNAVTHPDVPPAVMSCPADFGTDYTGVFYDGNRVLARYTYDASGCRRVGVIVGSITQSTMLAGPAASAAPHLVADFAAVMTGARPAGVPTTSNQNKGGMA